MRDIIPIRDLQRRMPEGGRIRIGKKKGNRPTSIGTFRFTSSDRDAIEQIAAHYGGQVQAWKEGYGDQWEVETEADEVRVVLPHRPLGDGPMYELWSGGGCQRRCDGEEAEVPGREEPMRVACICNDKQQMECKPKTRLLVILPDVKFGGVWRLDTGSWNAAQELPGMVEMVQQLQERGLTRGLLALERRQSKSGGQTKNFVVPTIRLDDSLDAVVSGVAQVNRLAAPDPKPALSAASQVDEGSPTARSDAPPSAPPVGDSTPPTPPEDTKDVPGEVVEDGEVAATSTGPSEKLMRKAFATMREYGWDYNTQVKPALKSVYDVDSIKEMEQEKVGAWLRAISDPDSRARFEEHFVTDAEIVEAE